MSLALAFAADAYRRYPGETLTFFAKVDGDEHPAGFRLQIMLPPGLALLEGKALGRHQDSLPQIASDEGGCYLIWEVVRKDRRQTCFECQVVTNIAATHQDITLTSKALLIALPEDHSPALEESVNVAVTAKGRYLKYLPAIYQDDELMGRFLMLFESFLKPIEQQIDHQADYLDPKLAPADFLPWLASWTNMALDESLPETRRRKLLEESSFLFRRRGTRLGLQRYLELFTGGKAQIIEHFSENFILGETARMGQGIALGLKNIPRTFNVLLTLPPEHTALGEAGRERKLAALIEAEKPVHAGYQLEISIEPDFDRQE